MISHIPYKSGYSSETSEYQTTSPNSSKHSSFSELSLNSSPRLPRILCRIFINRVGWALQLSTGEIVVQYVDGEEICVGTSPMTINYTDSKQQKYR